MKLITTVSVFLLCAAALSISGCNTPPSKSSGATPPKHPDTAKGSGSHFHKVTNLKFLPFRGKWVMSPEEGGGGTLILPNGQKFVNKTVGEEQVLTFPNGQVFKSETAKDDSHPVYVNEDGTLVADVRRPATQTGDLYLYLRGKDGKWKELPDGNRAVAQLLKGIKDAPSTDILILRGVKGRTVYLSTPTKVHGDTWINFEVNVAPDGKLTLL